MELTFVTDIGQTFVVEIDPGMELENVMALLEAEVSGSQREWPSRESPEHGATLPPRTVAADTQPS